AMTDSASLVPHNCSRPPACRNTGEPCCRRSNWTRPRKDSSHSYPSYRLTSINTSLSTSARIPYRSDREVSIEQRTTQGMVHICLVTGQTKPCAETRHSRWWSPDELTRLFRVSRGVPAWCWVASAGIGGCRPTVLGGVGFLGCGIRRRCGRRV